MRIAILTALTGLIIGAATAQGRTIDGSDSDWTGTHGGAIHTVVISSGEWIYKGEAGDLRGFGPTGPRPNYDVTEVRLARDSANLYVLVRFADVTDINEPSVCLGVDLDRSSSDSSGLAFFGDDAGTVFAGDASTHPEFLIQIHNAQNGITWAEYYDDVNPPGWFTNPGESETYISAANNLLEARLSLASLGLTPTSQFGVSLVSFDNGTTSDPSGQGFNNDTDTTVDYPDHDALDGMGGADGVSANAFTRVFGGGAGYAAVGIPVVDLNLLTAPTGMADWRLLD